MRIVLFVVLATIVAKSGGSSALRWLSWDEIREMMRDGVSEFKKQGEFVRPGKYPGAIYGGRFICKAAVGDQSKSFVLSIGLRKSLKFA